MSRSASHRPHGFARLPALLLALCAAQTDAGGLAGVVSDEQSAPLAGAWVMTCNGRVARTGADGAFAFTGLSAGGYAVKAVAPGREEAIRPCVAVTSDSPVSCRVTLQPSGRGTAVVSGQVTDAATGKKIAAWLEIRGGQGPVRWFDVAGRPYGGRTDIPAGVWHQKNSRYWCCGEFAFSAPPGKLQVTAHADGYAPALLTRTLRREAEETLTIPLQPLFDPASAGWFKGDFHAHGVHGEKLYDVNIPLIAFMLRAESYRWFYLSAGFANDGVPVDSAAAAAAENGPDLFLNLNAEYPKTAGGHIGNVGIAPPCAPLPYPRHSNTETVKRHIADQGGAAVALHPLFGHMRAKELPFLLLGAPELLCGFDFYTSWNERSEKTWGMFLNKGYRLCRTATSDAAFDLGRSPGTMGATFIHPAGGRLNRESIVDAFKGGRTTISWDGALLTFTLDGAVCGDAFPCGETPRAAALSLYYTPGARTVITVSRNGEPFKRFSSTLPASGKFDATFSLAEREKAWYTATCAMEGHPEKVIAATSPFYFGQWEAPARVLARINARVFDAATGAPIAAEIRLMDNETETPGVRAENGQCQLEACIFQRLKATAEGYAPQETGILGTPTISAFIASRSEEDLQNWDTYEKAAGLLKSVEVDFPMRRK